MTRLLRLLGVLVMVLALYAALMVPFPHARTLDNHHTLARLLASYGVLTLGVGVLIVSGGIDLSIGSLVALAAVFFARLIDRGVAAGVAAALIVAGGMVVGAWHGLLVTKARLQ